MKIKGAAAIYTETKIAGERSSAGRVIIELFVSR